jgi:cellulose synthase/poly-beta-1,6-N-acetylglucosamine synthase-like glycosyltransferase
MDSSRKTSFEIRLTACALVFTLVATGFFLEDMTVAAIETSFRHWVEVAIFTLIVVFLIYGNIAYQLSRIGHLQRRLTHRPAPIEELESCHDRPAQPLAILVPSYKEEARVVRQTLLSAALQEHPNRRVVLLIDDPFRFDDPDSLRALFAMRNLVKSLQRQMNEVAMPFLAAREAFERRAAAGGLMRATKRRSSGRCTSRRPTGSNARQRSGAASTTPIASSWKRSFASLRGRIESAPRRG